MKNLNPKETFTWLADESQEFDHRKLNNHTLKVEVYSAISNEKLLSRYIHLQDYTHANIPKVRVQF